MLARGRADEHRVGSGEAVGEAEPCAVPSAMNLFIGLRDQTPQSLFHKRDSMKGHADCFENAQNSAPTVFSTRNCHKKAVSLLARAKASLLLKFLVGLISKPVPLLSLLKHCSAAAFLTPARTLFYVSNVRQSSGSGTLFLMSDQSVEAALCAPSLKSPTSESLPVPGSSAQFLVVCSFPLNTDSQSIGRHASHTHGEGLREASVGMPHTHMP